MIEYSDNDLIGQYIGGNAQAFDTLIMRHTDSVYYFIVRAVGDKTEAEDLTQETFLKVWKQLERFDMSRSFKTWLFAIARNTAIDHLRKKKAVPMSAFDDADGNNVILDTLHDNEPLAEENFDRGLVRGFLSDLLKKLTPAYQTVVALRYENDFTFQEMSEVLGEPIDTVKSRYRRALLQLKKELKDHPSRFI